MYNKYLLFLLFLIVSSVTADNFALRLQGRSRNNHLIVTHSCQNPHICIQSACDIYNMINIIELAIVPDYGLNTDNLRQSSYQICHHLNKTGLYRPLILEAIDNNNYPIPNGIVRCNFDNTCIHAICDIIKKFAPMKILMKFLVKNRDCHPI